MSRNQKAPRARETLNAANDALDAARALAPGAERIEALKKAGLLRKEADKNGVIFAKRGRPTK